MDAQGRYTKRKKRRIFDRYRQTDNRSEKIRLLLIYLDMCGIEIKSDSSKNSIAKSQNSAIIKVGDSSSNKKDGAPIGNKNAAGPHDMKNRPTHFKTSDGAMSVDKDLHISASKSGKTSVTVKAGGSIDGVYSFAGEGSGKNYVQSGNLSKEYGVGSPEKWSHKCGFADVIAQDGSTQRAEIHWSEHPDVGQVKWKIKKR